MFMCHRPTFTKCNASLKTAVPALHKKFRCIHKSLSVLLARFYSSEKSATIPVVNIHFNFEGAVRHNRYIYKSSLTVA